MNTVVQIGKDWAAATATRLVMPIASVGALAYRNKTKAAAFTAIVLLGLLIVQLTNNHALQDGWNAIKQTFHNKMAATVIGVTYIAISNELIAKVKVAHRVNTSEVLPKMFEICSEDSEDRYLFSSR